MQASRVEGLLATLELACVPPLGEPPKNITLLAHNWTTKSAQLKILGVPRLPEICNLRSASLVNQITADKCHINAGFMEVTDRYGVRILVKYDQVGQVARLELSKNILLAHVCRGIIGEKRYGLFDSNGLLLPKAVDAAPRSLG